jgi:hypothetical protein
MSNFISTKRSNPCPCCGDIKGKCRSRQTSFSLPNGVTIDDVQIFCMNYRDDSDTYKFTGETSDHLWGKFITFDLANTLSAAWKTKKWRSNHKPSTVKRSPKPSPKTTRTNSGKSLLPIPERNCAIAAVLNQLSLSSNHKRALIERGFSDQQIEKYQFKSVTYRQPLSHFVSDRLPGVATGGHSLTNKFSGLIVPILNPDGFYLGWQYRLDYAAHCRYLWASSETTDGQKISAHLSEEDELPLAYCSPDDGVINHDYLGITEGVGFKPALTANKFGLICLGASGGLFASSPQLFQSYLIRASKTLSTNKVLLFPDAGAVQNHLVLRQYYKTIKLLTSFGYQVKVAWWGQINKSTPDCDELEGSYELLAPVDFFTLGLEYSAFFPDDDGRNLVRRFYHLLVTCPTPQELKKKIAIFQSKYFQQFDLIKRICWYHLNHQQKSYLLSLFST